MTRVRKQCRYVVETVFEVILRAKRSPRGYKPLIVLALALPGLGAGSATSSAQANGWTWVGGSSSVPTTCSYPLGCGQPGVYGKQGTAAATNVPGGKYGAANWTDNGGNLWLFSGDGVDSAGTPGGLDDLWEFDQATGQWEWVSGSNTLPSKWSNMPGIYGTQGVASATNTPGFRAHVNTWTDGSGNLWLFGAGDAGGTNDLWEYQPSAGTWTWVGGASSIASGSIGASGLYGVLGQASVTNWPGTRGASYSCGDNADNLWLFAGGGVDSVGNEGLLNDLWVYSPSLKEWVWMAGSKTVLAAGYYGASAGGPLPVYGTQGTPAPANTPGGRQAGACWVDSGGNVWIFGGFGQHANGMLGAWNDLWEFNPVSMQWTWMAGIDAMPGCVPNATVCGNPGVYGTQGTPSAGNTPGARVHASTWTDQEGNFWLFGGSGFDANDQYGFLNDLWEFSPTTRQWAWQGGSATIASCTPPLVSLTCGNTGVYGSEGVADAANTPGGRDSAMSWTDANGNLWLQGGEGYDGLGQYGDLNDQWMIAPTGSGLPGTAAPQLSLASGRYLSAQTVSISDGTPGATIYYTTDGTPPTLNSAVYSGPLSVTQTEAVEAIAVASGSAVSKITTGSYVLPRVFDLTAAPAALTLNAGSSSTITLIVTPHNGFSAPVTFQCKGLPVGASCAFSPASVAPAGAAISTTLTIGIAANTASARTGKPAFPTALAGLLMLAIGLRRRRGAGILLLVALMVALSPLVACGGGTASSGGGGGTQATTSMVTVFGLTTGESETTTIALTVN